MPKIITEAAQIGELTGELIQVTLITPGQGSSGFYPADTLKEAAGLFIPGTHMYLDHASETERWERPEGSLKNLVGVLETGATITPEGGLEATARIFTAYRELIKEAAPYIGVSISGTGDLEEVNGIPTITKLHAIESVDFVTKPGRGGQITKILEHAIKKEKEGKDEMNVTISEAAHQKLTEDAAKAATLEKQIEDLEKQLEDAQAELEKEQVKSKAAEEASRKIQIDSIINEAFAGVDAPLGKKRLAAEAMSTAVFDAEAFKTLAQEAAAEYAVSTPKNLGDGLTESQTVTREDFMKYIKEGC